jgi:hypothetical protein
MLFIRDGMVISFSLRRPTVSNDSTKKDSYVFIELKEFVEDLSGESEKNVKRDDRFILISPSQLSKFLLLNPKSYVESKGLDNINFHQKFRDLVINQLKDNKYLFTLEVFPKAEEGQASEKLISQIELNPEDVALLKKFINNCIDELLNL